MIISIIGAGNMAYQLGHALKAAGHTIDEVYNRTKRRATALAKELDASTVSEINDLGTEAEVIIVAVSDDAISEVAKQLKHLHKKKTIIVHTSGSMSMEAVSSARNHGVFYPFQSMTVGQEIDFNEVPVLISANNDSNRVVLSKLAYSVSELVYEIDDVQRGVIHIAGVFANNFSNHMMALAKGLLEKEQLPFDIIKPLIINTAAKVQNMDPKAGQTGPAVRGDSQTIQNHLAWLDEHSDMSEVYKVLTSSIQKMHKANHH